MNSYYSPLLYEIQQQSSSTEPVILRLKNATFQFDKSRNRSGVDENNADIVDFKLDSLNVDVKQVICTLVECSHDRHIANIS